MRDAISEFQAYNRAFARRNPTLLRLKVARMAESAFAFFRGTFHLYARDILAKIGEANIPVSRTEVEMDLVGDIHSQNYGTFQAEDGTVHYDINDFDETTHGRFDFDVRRMTAGLILDAHERGQNLLDKAQVAIEFLSAYTETVRHVLKKGKELDLDITPNSPAHCAPVDSLIHAAAASKRPAVIESITDYAHGSRKLRRSARYFNLPEQERDQVLRLLEDYKRRIAAPASEDFYKVEDVCGRVSGIGSMGRLRYVALLNGKSSAEARNVLLEFKEARPSAYDIYRERETDETSLKARAERVIAVQRQSQAKSNRHLGFALDGAMSFQVRELGPHDSRLDVKVLKTPADLREVARLQARILARTHGRAAAQAIGVTNPLAELTDGDAFAQRVLAFALFYADLMQRDWVRFVGHRPDLEECEQWAAS